MKEESIEYNFIIGESFDSKDPYLIAYTKNRDNKSMIFASGTLERCYRSCAEEIVKNAAGRKIKLSSNSNPDAEIDTTNLEESCLERKLETDEMRELGKVIIKVVKEEKGVRKKKLLERKK